MTDKLRAMLEEAVLQLEYLNEKEQRGTTNAVITRARTVLAAAPQPAPEDDYHNDPSADDRWNAGCDYAMTALCKLLRINTDDVTWDAATEELEGDVLAVLGNILTVRFGDDWRMSSPQPAVADRDACRAKQAEPDRGFDETPYDRGYVWGYRHGLRDGKAEVAPQPALADREALVEVIYEVLSDRIGVCEAVSDDAAAVADALLARGLRLTGDDALQQLADLGQQADRASETMAWAVVGEDEEIDPRKLWINSRDAEEYCERGERAVRVAIRMVEGGDDAA